MDTTKENLNLPCLINNNSLTLDEKLHFHIDNYLAKDGNSTRSLENEIVDFMNDKYRFILSEANKNNDAALLERIKVDLVKHTPSRTLMTNYYKKNHSICTRYTNTLALFFNQKYTISEYDPSVVFFTKYMNAS